MNEFSPYLEFSRNRWKTLGKRTPSPLSISEIERLRGFSTPLDLHEVEEIYIPLSRLIYLQYQARTYLHQQTCQFIQSKQAQVPFILGIAGSVAVGKSTTARVLQELLRRWEENPRVDLITTDGFLYNTATLEQKKILHQKGFPESYDRKGLLKFLHEVKSGKSHIEAPVYSHLKYDIVPDEKIHIDKPNILILEGLNVLQTGPTLMVSDFFDFSLYVDASTELLENWYTTRFLEMRHQGFNHPDSPFQHFAQLNDAEATKAAHEIWQSINLPNLHQNILPTKPRADLILVKGENHLVDKIKMRKI